LVAFGAISSRQDPGVTGQVSRAGEDRFGWVFVAVVGLGVVNGLRSVMLA